MNYLRKICKNLYLYPCALSDGLSRFHMISIFFHFFFMILNWHHKRFTHKFLKKEKDQNCFSKSPRVSMRRLSLLSCRCRPRAVWHWVSKEASQHQTRQIRRPKDEAETCWQFAMRLRADPSILCSFFPLEGPNQATVPFWSKFSFFSGAW